MKRSAISILFLVCLAFRSLYAFDHSHKNFDSVLDQYVVDQGASSTFRYPALKSDPKLFDRYLAELSQVNKATFDRWNENQRLAFLINAYNAFTIRLILNHYPLDSIKDIGRSLFRPFPNPWKDQKIVDLFGNKTYLDQVEHDWLRKNFKEPRIHFAVNCASIGCPKLAKQAYQPQVLDRQLDEAARLFLNDSSRNRFDASKKKLSLSKIFDWYRSDFESKKQSLQAFVALYLNVTPEQKPILINADIEFLSYDWNLNNAAEGMTQ